MSLRRREKIRAEGSMSSVGLPSGGHTEGVVAAVAPEVAVDAETAGTEVADVDTVAVRVHTRTADVDFLEQPFSSREKVADDRVDHRAGSRRLLVALEQSLLFRPCLAGRVHDRRLPDELPLRLAFLLGEGLPVVPVLIVEQASGLCRDLAADLEDRELEDCSEHVSVAAGLKRRLGERDLGEDRELRRRGFHAEVLHRFLDAEEVLPHDLTGVLLARRRFEATVHD